LGSARGLATILLGAGAASLALKLLVILVTDGEVTDTGLAAVFLLAGVVLVVLGFALFAAWLAGRWPLVVRVLAGAAGVVAFFVLFGVLDSIGKNFASDSSYWQDEIGILLTALLAAALAGLAWTPPATRETR
jgi:hypothetical protein